MTIECSRSVHSIVLRMAQMNSNVFYKCYKYKKGGLFCQEVVQNMLEWTKWIFVAKKSNIFSVMTCLESFSNRPPSVLTGCRVIIFLKETDIASDVGVADLLADRLDRVGSVGQQREGTFRAVAV